jgi:hypothetical protein
MCSALPGKSWKILIYLGADNSLYQFSKTSIDHIEKQAIASDNLDVLAQWDGPTQRDIKRLFFSNRRKQIVKTPRSLRNVGRYTRLRSFIKWSFRTCSSEKTALILWGHGDGVDHSYFYVPRITKTPINQSLLTEQSLALPLPSLGATDLDEGVLNRNNPNVYLSDSQLAQLLISCEQNGNAIDVLGFDACLMAMVEICYELREATSSMVASEAVIPKTSWPYASIISAIESQPDLSPPEFGRVCVDEYDKEYSNRRNRPVINLSCFDLKQWDSVVLTMKDFISCLLGAVENSQSRSHIRSAMTTARYLEESDYIDVGTFCSEITRSFTSDQTGTSAEKVIRTLSKAVYYCSHSGGSPISSAGVSLYFPLILPGGDLNKEIRQIRGSQSRIGHRSKKAEILDFQINWSHYRALSFPKITRWADFIELFFKLEGES